MVTVIFWNNGQVEIEHFGSRVIVESEVFYNSKLNNLIVTGNNVDIDTFSGYEVSPLSESAREAIENAVEELHST